MRVLIYEIALSRVDALDIIVFPWTTNLKPGAPTVPTATVLNRAHLIPAIFRLNKETSNEAMPYLYARNTFMFVGLEECRAFTDPSIPGRALISRVGLPRMAMSRPISRWDSLHTFLPSNLRHLTIEIDTHSVSFTLLCRSLCRGLGFYLKQVHREPAARWDHFKNTVTLRLHPTKYLEGLDVGSPSSCFTETQQLLWQRLVKSKHISHAAVERCLRDMIEDGLVGAGVFSKIHMGA